MTENEKDEIRASVREQWRKLIVEEEQAKLGELDPVRVGINVARALAEHKDQIEDDISEAIEAAETRRTWNSTDG